MMNCFGEKHELLSSTQSALKELLRDKDLPPFYYVLSQEQSQGRGRSDHEWLSAKGNLHVSILINEIPFSVITWIPLWISVSLHETLVDFGVQSQRLNLKWPNDLWLDGTKKVGGILCEKINHQFIAGIGLNLKQAPLPNAGVVPSQNPLDAEWVLTKLIEKLKKPTSIQDIQGYYLRFCLFQSGEVVSWKSEVSQEVLHGEVIGLGDFGELKVMIEGKVCSLYSEEVSTIRTSEAVPK